MYNFLIHSRFIPSTKLWMMKVLLVYSLFNFSVSILAIIFDIKTAKYFSHIIHKCPDNVITNNNNIICYCNETKQAYENIFQGLGHIECNHFLIRNPGLLIANVCLDFICNWISAVITILLLHNIVKITLLRAKIARDLALAERSDTRYILLIINNLIFIILNKLIIENYIM